MQIARNTPAKTPPLVPPIPLDPPLSGVAGGKRVRRKTEPTGGCKYVFIFALYYDVVPAKSGA